MIVASCPVSALCVSLQLKNLSVLRAVVSVYYGCMCAAELGEVCSSDGRLVNVV